MDLILIVKVYKFHRLNGKNPLSAYIAARRNLSFLRERSVNAYLESILNEVLHFREVNGYKKPFLLKEMALVSSSLALIRKAERLEEESL